MSVQWGAKGAVEVVPHSLPDWPKLSDRPLHEPFTVGYAGRLVEEKGLRDLIEASDALDVPHRLRLVGDGPLRAFVEAASRPSRPVEVVTNVQHQEMHLEYCKMDVLVLPSRTTPTWAEQFGRVLPEAAYCRVLLIGSSSGEIPNVIASLGGGMVFPEGDVGALAQGLRQASTNWAGLASDRSLAALRAEQLYGSAECAIKLARLLKNPGVPESVTR